MSHPGKRGKYLNLIITNCLFDSKEGREEEGLLNMFVKQILWIIVLCILLYLAVKM